MIISGISKTVNNTMEKGKNISNKIQFHNILQYNIARLARKYGYSYMREYHVHDRGDGIEGSIDVAWFDKDTLIAAIEIDSSLRQKSIRKLMSTDAALKIWIYYGNKSVGALPADVIVLQYQRQQIMYPTRCDSRPGPSQCTLDDMKR